MVRFEAVHTTESIRLVADLAKTIWHEAYSTLLEQSQRDYMIAKFQSETAIEAQIKEGMQYFLLFYQDTLAGYLGLGVEDDCLLLSKVYLLATMRQKGIFSDIVLFSKEIARGQNKKSLRLYVNKYNPALKAYQARGFKNVGSVVKDIGSGYIMDDFCMELSIL